MQLSHVAPEGIQAPVGMHALVIGTGSIGRRHLGSIRTLDPASRILLLRRSADRDALADELGAEIVTDYATAIAARPDFAVIATPSALHADALVPLIAAGIPLYVEKPVVTSRTQLEMVRDALQRHDYRAPSLVGCNLRFLPSLKRARALIRAGALGTVVRATFQAGQWLPDWRPGQDYRASYSADAQRGGGVVLDLIHEIDMARFMFGEFDQVKALSGRFSALEIATEDAAWALLGRRTGGPIAAVGLDYVSRRPMRRYEIVGDAATLVWDLPTTKLELVGPTGSESIDVGPQAFDVSRTYLEAMSEFLAAVGRGQGSSQDIADGLASVDLALAVKEDAP